MRHHILLLFFLTVISASVVQSAGLKEDNLSVVISKTDYVYDAKLCYDQNYLLTGSGSNICLWDLNKRRIVRNISCDTKYFAPSPLGTEWVNVKLRNGNGVVNKYCTLNLITGTYIPANTEDIFKFTDDYFLYNHPDYDFALKDKGVVLYSKEGLAIDTLKTVKRIKAGRIALDRNDSLMLVAGCPSIIYDLKNAKVTSILEGTEVNVGDAKFVFNSESFQPEGRFLSDSTLQVSFNGKDLFVYSTDGRLKQRVKIGEKEGMFDSDSHYGRLEIGFGSEYYHYDERYLGFWKTAAVDVNDSIIVMGSYGGDIGIWKKGEKQCLKLIPYEHEDAIADIILNNEKSKIIIVSRNGTITIRRCSDMEKILTIYPLGTEGDYVFITPDNYYKASKNSLDAISFVKNLDTYSFDQFDLRFNRPDIILERLGANVEQIQTYERAWHKRLARAGFDSGSFSDDLEVPELSLCNYDEIKKVSDINSLRLGFDFYDAKYNVRSLSIKLNGVDLEVTDQDIDQLREMWSDHSKHCLFATSIELVYGDNHVEVSMTNENGVESYPVSVDVFCNMKPDKRTLFVAGIGVSDYLQKEYNLKYAHKDAQDFTELIGEIAGKQFDEVKTLNLSDDQFTDSSMGMIEDFFSEGKRNDVQLLLYAGHGVLDENMDYYLSTYNMDFQQPALHGIAYERLENAFHNSRAVNRVCFIDACHSGELFKDDYKLVKQNVSANGPLVFRSAGKDIEILSKETKRLSSLINDIFVDVRRNSGVTVISSAGSAELAYEDDNWNNGLFTWCLKDGLRNGNADLDNDGHIDLNELTAYLRANVSALSNNVQTPVVRVANKYSNRIVLK